uniref:AIG1-type G domain-containing protein n=1 Tax=Stegastes partitus TaxID=144197 RepID=A0A3B5B5U9_9TELE
MNKNGTSFLMALLGKTGAGKSSLVQTIFGEPVFNIHHSANSGTSKCKKATRQVDGGSITVIDTPGFFDNRTSDDEPNFEIIDSIIERRCDGLDAFLIVLKVERFTEHENEVVSKIRKYFSEEVFNYSAVVFTHGDQLSENMNIKDFISNNKHLKDLVETCGGRCHVVDNKYWQNNQQGEYRSNQFQVAQLLNTIDDMVKRNGGGCYSTEMLQEWKRQQRKPSLVSFLRIVRRWMKCVTRQPVRTLFGVAAIIGALLIVKAVKVQAAAVGEETHTVL